MLFKRFIMRRCGFSDVTSRSRTTKYTIASLRNGAARACGEEKKMCSTKQHEQGFKENETSLFQFIFFKYRYKFFISSFHVALKLLQKYNDVFIKQVYLNSTNAHDPKYPDSVIAEC